MNYLDWARRHAAMFGLTRPQDADLVLGWARAFRQSGYSVHELAEASDWLAGHAPPRYREDHLADLVARRRAVRAEQQERAPPVGPQGPDCPLCGTSGWVGVPSRKQIRQRGAWHGGIEAVYCTCARGNAVRTRGPCVDDVEVYTRFVPNWQQMLQTHHDSLLELAGASSRARELDGLLGSILGRLSAREQTS